jgi:hypothetical protein
MNDMIKSKLVALEAKLDAKLFAAYRGPDGRYYEEQPKSGFALRGTGIPSAAAATVAAGYGAYRADQAIMGRYGQRNLLPLGSMEPGSPRSISTRSAAPANVAPGSLQTGVSRRAAYGQAFTDAKNTVMSKGQQGLQAGKQAFRAGAAEVGNTTNVLTRLRRALRIGARVATGGRIG